MMSPRELIVPPSWARSTRLTPKRLRNLYLNRWEHWRGRTTLRSFPLKLMVEPTNGSSAMSLELYRRLLAELGDRLFEVEAPLGGEHVPAMIAEAAKRGITTTLTTSFDLPFDTEKAEQLIATGLSTLRVSIDGDVYEQYLVGETLENVLANCRLMAEAKRRLRVSRPVLVWEHRVPAHDRGDAERARVEAAGLGMEFVVVETRTVPAALPWSIAVVHGGDDQGRFALRRTFDDIWNGPRYQAARQTSLSDRARSPW